MRSSAVLLATMAFAASAQNPIEIDDAEPEADPDELALNRLVRELREPALQAEQRQRPCETREPLEAASQDLHEQIVELRESLAELCQRLNENHPDVVSRARQLDILEARANIER